jgi:metal-dependent hydrolase (beta-lactamase superfamily II)
VGSLGLELQELELALIVHGHPRRCIGLQIVEETKLQSRHCAETGGGKREWLFVLLPFS